MSSICSSDLLCHTVRIRLATPLYAHVCIVRQRWCVELWSVVESLLRAQSSCRFDCSYKESYRSHSSNPPPRSVAAAGEVPHQGCDQNDVFHAAIMPPTVHSHNTGRKNHGITGVVLYGEGGHCVREYGRQQLGKVAKNFIFFNANSISIFYC